MSVAEVARDIFQVRLPLPFALSSVNCYLLRDGDGWTVLDTGLHTPDGAAGWRAAFAELGIRPAAIRQIVLTHFHPDHFGMAGWLQSQSGAPVLIAPREAELAHLVWGKPDELPDPSLDHFLRYGMPADLAHTIVGEIARLRIWTRPHPTLTPLAPGEAVTMGRRRFLAIHAPGHSDGQLLFLCAEEGVAFCGDQVLLKISPHIGLWPESEPDPLGRYLGSLHDLARLEVRLALSGHGRLIEAWAERLHELRHHHEQRLDLMLNAAGDHATAYTVATRAFDFARLSPHEKRFAVAETIAHLELLAARGAVRRSVEDTIVVYRR